MAKKYKAEIAQLAERIHGKDKVPGPIPGLGSRVDGSLPAFGGNPGQRLTIEKWVGGRVVYYSRL